MSKSEMCFSFVNLADIRKISKDNLKNLFSQDGLRMMIIQVYQSQGWIVVYLPAIRQLIFQQPYRLAILLEA